MKKLLHFSIYYLALLLVEMVVEFCCLLFDSFNFQGNIDGVILTTLWRVLFYGLPWVAIFWVFYYRYSSSLDINKRLLLLSVVNLLVYVGLSCVSEMIWGKNVPLPAEGIMFKVTCVAVIVSPLLVGQIPFFRYPAGMSLA